MITIIHILQKPFCRQRQFLPVFHRNADCAVCLHIERFRDDPVRYALLLFGSNGIVASRISMNSYEIVMFRTLIGSLLLIILYLATNHRFTFYKHKKSFAFLALSASVYVLIRLVGALCIIAGAVGAELKQT